VKKFFILILVFFSILNTVYSATNINSCQALTTIGETYTLTTDILDSTTSNCIDIQAHDITLDCQGHLIDGNDAVSNGIVLFPAISQSSNVTVRNCRISDYGNAFYIRNSDNNSIENISISSGTSFQFYTYLSNNNTYRNITISDQQSNSISFYIQSSNGNFFEDINLINVYQGFRIHDGDNNIFNNILVNDVSSSHGFFLTSYSDSNQLYNSTISNVNSAYYGIDNDRYSTNNLFYNNILNNTNNAYKYSSNTAGTLFHNNGVGNYWFSPNGDGFSDICGDYNSDGICDGVFIASSLGITDNFPLAKTIGQTQDYTVDKCTILSIPGTYTLTTDIIDSTISYCMDIVGTDITLDCAGHLIDGNDAVTYGIYLSRTSSESSNVTVRNCRISDYSNGVYIRNSNDNLIDNISINSGMSTQIMSYTSHNNTYRNINISDQQSSGISFYLYYSHNNSIEEFTLSNVYRGFYLNNGNNNIFQNILINGVSSDHGFYLWESSDSNQLYNSSISNVNSAYYGIYNGRYAENNLFYNNVLNNTLNAYKYGSNTGGTLFYNAGIGNYWLTPNEDGFSNLCPDVDVNGFCDNPPYSLTGALDNFPQTPLSPNLLYTNPTPNDGATNYGSFFSINVSTDKFPTICTLTFNGINYTMQTKSNYCYYTISGLENNNYYNYYVTGNFLGYKSSTAQRNIYVEILDPNYIYPTPKDKSKIIDSEITISVSYNDNIVTSCQLNLANGSTYPMIDAITYCYYPLNLTNALTSGKMNHGYNISYVIDSQTKYLENRVFTQFYDKSNSNNQNFPSFGIGSFIFSILLLVLFI